MEKYFFESTVSSLKIIKKRDKIIMVEVCPSSLRSWVKIMVVGVLNLKKKINHFFNVSILNKTSV